LRSKRAIKLKSNMGLVVDKKLIAGNYDDI
jgi:hypothetical protein